MATLDFSSYDGLQAAIANYLRRQNLSDQIPGFIQAAEMRLNLLLTTLNQQMTTITLTPTGNFVNLPSDISTIHSVWYNEKKLEQISPEMASFERERYNDKFYTLIGNQLWLQCQIITGYTLVIIYYQEIEALDETNTSNWLLEDYPMVYLYASLIEGCAFVKDEEGLQIYQSLLTQALNDVQAQGKRVTVSRGKLKQKLG